MRSEIKIGIIGAAVVAVLVGAAMWWRSKPSGEIKDLPLDKRVMDSKPGHDVKLGEPNKTSKPGGSFANNSAQKSGVSRTPDHSNDLTHAPAGMSNSSRGPDSMYQSPGANKPAIVPPPITSLNPPASTTSSRPPVQSSEPPSHAADVPAPAIRSDLPTHEATSPPAQSNDKPAESATQRPTLGGLDRGTSEHTTSEHGKVDGSDMGHRNGIPSIANGATKPPVTIGNAAKTTTGAYTIKESETLTSIARTQYGDGKYWTAIKAANPGLEETKLKVGQSINLPAKETVLAGSKAAAKPGADKLAGATKSPATATRPTNAAPTKANGSSGGGPAVTKAPNPTAPPKTNAAGATAADNGGTTHVVKEHETLTSISRTELGDEHRWQEILDLNRDKISSPDMIIEGMRLKLPARKAAPQSGPPRGR